MNIDFYAYLVLGLALVLANLPFVNQRLLLVFPLKPALVSLSRLARFADGANIPCGRREVKARIVPAHGA